MSWTPDDIPGRLLWLPCDYPAWLWQGTVDASAVATVDGHEVRNVICGNSSLTASAPNDNSRPIFRTDDTRYGSLQFGSVTNNRYLSVGSASTFNAIQNSGTGYIFGWLKRTAVGSNTQGVMNTSGHSANNKGWEILFNTSNQLRLRLCNGSGTAIADISGANSLINHTNWVYFEAEIAAGTGNTKISINGGTPVTGTLGTLSTGDATSALVFAARALVFDQAGNIQLDNVYVGSSIPNSTDRAALIAFNPPVQPAPRVVLHEFGIGGVTGTKARWKMRWSPIGDMDIEYSRNADLSDSTIGGTGTNSTDTDAAGGGEITGLTPGTRYYYSPVDEAEQRVFAPPYPYFRTPRNNRIKVAFGSCQTTPTESQIYATIAGEDPDVFLHLGDRGYPDNNGVTQQRNNYKSQHADDFYRNDLIRKVATECIYDDHDGGPNNWNGDTDGKAGALQVLKEVTPMHDLASPDNGAWRKWTLGNDLVEFFMIDVRYQRQAPGTLTRFPASSTNTADTGSSGSTLVLRSADSPSGTNNAYTGHYVFVGGVIRKITNYVGASRTATLDAAVPGLSSSSTYFIRGATYLGAEQLAWLIDGINDSTARWKAIVSPTNFNPTYNPATYNDRWGEFDNAHLAERSYLVQQITASDVVVLSGDAHFSAIDDGTNCNYPECTSSHLNRSDIVTGGSWSHGTNDVGTKYAIADFTPNACKLFVRDRTGANVSGITPLTVSHSSPIAASGGRRGGINLGIGIGL